MGSRGPRSLQVRRRFGCRPTGWKPPGHALQETSGPELGLGFADELWGSDDSGRTKRGSEPHAAGAMLWRRASEPKGPELMPKKSSCQSCTGVQRSGEKRRVGDVVRQVFAAKNTAAVAGLETPQFLA